MRAPHRAASKQLHIADEMRLAGTLAELTPVVQVDEYELPTSAPLTERIAATFWKSVRGVEPHASMELTFV